MFEKKLLILFISLHAQENKYANKKNYIGVFLPFSFQYWKHFLPISLRNIKLMLFAYYRSKLRLWLCAWQQHCFYHQIGSEWVLEQGSKLFVLNVSIVLF